MKTILTALMALMSLTATAQCQYCNTYEDFIEDHWQKVDTIYCAPRSNEQQMWWDGSKYTLSTGDKSIDKFLKKKAFAVMINGTLYVNCYNLQYNFDRFGKGYVQAMRIGQRSLLVVCGVHSRWSSNPSAVVAFGVVGAALLSPLQNYCFVISSGANERGKINVRLIDDELMEQMIADANHYELNNEYYAELETERRLQSEHVIPILVKAGYIKSQSALMADSSMSQEERSQKETDAETGKKKRSHGVMVKAGFGPMWNLARIYYQAYTGVDYISNQCGDAFALSVVNTDDRAYAFGVDFYGSRLHVTYPNSYGDTGKNFKMLYFGPDVMYGKNLSKKLRLDATFSVGVGCLIGESQSELGFGSKINVGLEHMLSQNLGIGFDFVGHATNIPLPDNIELPDNETYGYLQLGFMLTCRYHF